MSRYVALLRGINVGGNNLIRMPALKACLEREGFGDVITYIQSGNVLFTENEASRAKLVHRIEAVLSSEFDYPASVVVRSREQLREIVERAPQGFGTRPGEYRYDVLFLKEPMTASITMKSVLTKPGVDQAWPGNDVVYFSRLISKATQSRLSRIVSLPIYQSMTIRNWNTTTKLLELIEVPARGEGGTPAAPLSVKAGARAPRSTRSPLAGTGRRRS